MLSKLSNRRLLSGFTIIELMVAMAIAAILMGMALPAFNNFIAQRTMAALGNDFISAVNLARSEAVNRSVNVSIQALNPQAADEWGGGYCVTVTPGNCNNPLRTFSPTDDATLDALAGLDGVTTLTFNSRGLMTLGVQGTIQICGAGINPGREIALNTIGRASSAEFVCP